jgi:predicted nucleic acid-binding protein
MVEDGQRQKQFCLATLSAGASIGFGPAMRGRDATVPTRIDVAAGDGPRLLSVLTAAEHAGRIRRTFGPQPRHRPRRRGLAATALERSVALVTDNRRQFPMPGLELC